MLTTSNPPTTVSVPVATTGAEGKTKVDNNMSGDPVAITTDSIGIPSGVAELDAGGIVPVAELPLDIAYKDAENTFTESQTVDSGSGYSSIIASDNILIQDTPGDYMELTVNGIFINSLTGDAMWETIVSYMYDLDTVQLQLSNADTILTGSFYVGNTGTDISNNVYLLGNRASTPKLAKDGPASTIHQDDDGSIHFQVFPTGTLSDPIIWTDALTVNNNGRTIIENGCEILDPDTGAEIDMYGGVIIYNANDPILITLFREDTSYQTLLANTGSGLDFASNAQWVSSASYTRNTTGPSTNIHQDIDGTIHLQTAPTGTNATHITWTDALIINNDGTIDLASTPTTTTAPSSGMADALPVLPTGYATIDIGGTPRQIAYY